MVSVSVVTVSRGGNVPTPGWAAPSRNERIGEDRSGRVWFKNLDTLPWGRDDEEPLPASIKGDDDRLGRRRLNDGRCVEGRLHGCIRPLGRPRRDDRPR